MRSIAMLILVLSIAACGGGGSKSANSSSTTEPVTTTLAPTTTTIPLSLYAQADSQAGDIFLGMGVVADNPSYFTPAQQEADCNLLIKQVEIMVRMLPTAKSRLGDAWAAVIETLQRTYLACKARPRSFTAADWANVKQDVDRFQAADGEFTAAFTAAP